METKEKLSVRPATVADASTVGRLVHRLLQIVVPPEKLMPEADAVEAAGRLLRPGGGLEAYLAEAGGEAVGVITLTELHAVFARGAFGEIAELFVEPVWRSARVGERLVEQAKVHGRARRWSRLELSAPLAGSAGAERAWAFYRRLGFGEVGPRMMLKL